MKRCILFAAHLLVLLLSACGLGQTATPTPVLDIGDAVIATESRLLDRGQGIPAAGEIAPDFSFTLADGTTQKLSDLRGKRVLLNFWATWCLPCVEEMPAMQQALDEAASDLVILAVNRNELPEAISRFAPKVDVTFPLIADLSGAIGDRYGVSNLPTSYFINSDGTISARQIAALTPATLAERLEATQ